MSLDHPLGVNVEAQRQASLSRRHFLRGVSACIALPALHSILPGSALADEIAVGSAGRMAASASGAPMRMAFVYFPNGAIPSAWWPTTEGTAFELNRTMQPLAGVKGMIQAIGGLDCDNAEAGPDGAGDHARASGSFLTGVRVKKTAGSDIHAGISIDQIAANQIGHLTRFPSLELSCDSVRKSGSCDSGYSCAYQYNLAWRSPTTPVPPEPNPRLLFERLFGAGAPGERKKNMALRQAQQRSVLDFVLGEVDSLQPQMGARDKQKLDEYLSSIRDIEKRIESAEKFADRVPDPDIATPDGVPADFGAYVDLMFDMLILAFQTDSTRVATFLLANEGSNRSFPEIGFSEGHHFLSHHRNNPDMIDKVQQIDRWYMARFARFLNRMSQTTDANGTSLLHNSMILYGGGNADGNRHTHTNLPIILAGAGGGTLTSGRYVKHTAAPITNLYLSMLDRMGAKGVPGFGDATGRLEDI